MSTERDVGRIVRSWLREDRHEDADRVLDTVLSALDTTPQRRSWWSAWRHPVMNNTVRIWLAAAAVVVVVFLGYQFLSGPNVGGPSPLETPTPSPVPTATPEATPAPTPAAYLFPEAGPLAIGRHTLTAQGVSLSFSVPTSGWSVDNYGAIVKDTEGAGDQFLFWSPVNVYSDPCAKTPLSPPPGPLAEDLAVAISTAHGSNATEPSDVTVGGRAAKHVVLAVPEGIDCDPHFYLWYDACGGAPSDAEGCYRYATELGDTIRVWIVDVDGARLFIQADTRKGASPEVEQEIQQIVDSIVFE